MALTDLASLALVGVEWYAVGAVSAMDWAVASGPSARVALRILTGAVLVACAQLVLALLGAGFSSLPLVLLVAAAFALPVRLARVRHTSSLPPLTSTAERISWLLLALVLVAATVRSLLVPESGWDAYSHWGLRAQAYALAGTIVDAGSEHEYYPPLVPLLEAWLYLHTGAINIDVGKTIWGLVGSCFAVSLAWHVRRILPLWLAPLTSAAVLISIATLLDGFWTGQADLALTASLTLATLAAWQYLRSHENAWILQTAVFAAAAGLTKLEGTPRVLIVAAAVLLAARQLKPTLALALPAIAATVVWSLAAQRAGISANSEHLGSFQLAAIGPTLLALLQVFAGVRTGGAVLAAILAWLVASRRMPKVLSVVVAGQLALTLLAFLFSDTDPSLEVRTSATRLFAQFLPLALVAAAVGLRKRWSNL